MKRVAALLAVLAASAASAAGPARPAGEMAALCQTFQSPPDDARPMVRWWWFGPAVTDAEIDREIAAMKAGGFGGFEVQPVYPQVPDGALPGLKNLPYLSDAFIARLRHAGGTARKTHMRLDVTIGSGWPFGGPSVPVSEAAAELRMVRVNVPAGAAGVALPRPGPGEHLLAVFVDGKRFAPDPAGQLGLHPSPRSRVALVFVAGRTGQQVKRAAVGAEGFVVDHMSPAAVQHYLHAVGDRLLSAFAGTEPPYAMFSDSLEAYGSDWTDDFLVQFRKRRGYDLLDHLPALFLDRPDSAAVRYDWARTLTELVDERYLAPTTAWAHAHGTRFRAQVYGIPPVTLSSYALVDLPEGEGPDWRHFTTTRWATSAAHLYGRNVVSAETWTWLHSPAWAATPLDMKVEVDRDFLQGVNQIVGHGWPYSPPGVAEPGWSFYAAAALNDHNPWYPVMPAVTGYVQRMSAMLRAGAPESRVAIYLPTEDAFAAMTPDDPSVNRQMSDLLGPDLVNSVLKAGDDFDFIDGQAIAARGLRQKILILPRLTRIDPAVYRRIAGWVMRGGIVIATGSPPSKSGGLLDGAAQSCEVAALSARLFKQARAHVVAPTQLTATLRAVARPTMALTAAAPMLGFIHRRLADGDLYFIANTGPTPIETRARFIGGGGPGEWWDPMTGTRTAAGSGKISVRLAPYQSKVLVFGATIAAAPPAPRETLATIADLRSGWVASRRGTSIPNLDAGRSWTDDRTMVHYSGAVTYARSVAISAATLAGKARVVLDFGKGTPLAEPPGNRPRAALKAPIGVAATVSVNGHPAGTVWAPPWRLDVTKLLRAGINRIEVTVMNSALNELSGRSSPDRRLLTLRYGERFQDQDLDKVAPQPSGLLGTVTLDRIATSRR